MLRVVIAAAIFSFSVAISVSAATISLDGTWQAEAVPEVRGEAVPAVFTRTIPVPGHWPLMKPAVKDNMSDALWCRTTWKAPAELPPRVTLRIGKASFGTTVFVNGKKAGFFPYNFVASETNIRPFLKPGVENEIVVRHQRASIMLSFTVGFISGQCPGTGIVRVNEVGIFSPRVSGTTSACHVPSSEMVTADTGIAVENEKIAAAR